jgi:hypothetical protein
MRDFLLGEEWLEEAVERFAERGWSTDQITDHINAWVARVVAYVVYLTQESYSVADIVESVNSAINSADFGLSKMPVVP